MATLEAGDRERNDHGVEQAPAGVGNVDAGLRIASGVAHHLEKQVGVVGQQRVSGHLGEKTHEGGDEHTAAHTSGAEHIHPRLLGVLKLELDGGANLSHLGLDNLGVGITFSVVLGKNSEGLILTVARDEPTRTLGKAVDGADLQERRANLQERRQTPAPVTLDVDSPDGNGGGGNGANEVRGIEERGQDSTLLGITKFTNQGGTGDDSEQNADTEKHTGNDVHSHCIRLSVQFLRCE